MRILVLLGVFTATLAHPLPDDCDETLLVPASLSYAAAPLAYAAATPVHLPLPPAEVKVPVTQTHFEVPVHQQVRYGTQPYVAGTATSIHKPALVAPVISPPLTLPSKITYKAPEVTVQHQEVPVENHIPKFVEKAYHAGTIVKYTAPEVKDIKVPIPYAQPVSVVQPVAIPHSVPVAAPVHSLTVHQAFVSPFVKYAAVAPTGIRAARAALEPTVIITVH